MTYSNRLPVVAILALLFYCLGYWAGVNRSPPDRFVSVNYFTAFDRKTGQECWTARSGRTSSLPTCFDVYRGSLPKWFVGDPMRYAKPDVPDIFDK